MLLERGFKVLWNSQEEVIWCVYFVIIHLAFVHLSVHMLYINFQKEKNIQQSMGEFEIARTDNSFKKFYHKCC